MWVPEKLIKTPFFKVCDIQPLSVNRLCKVEKRKWEIKNCTTRVYGTLPLPMHPLSAMGVVVGLMFGLYSVYSIKYPRGTCLQNRLDS
jgi:hypothetical protein